MSTGLIPRLMKVAEVAAEIRRSPQTVRKLIKDGLLAAQWQGPDLFVRETDVVDYLDQQYVPKQPK